MCDTVGRIGKENELTFFAKNSDRQVKEPQVMVFVPEKYPKEKKLKTTYIEIEQVEHTYAMVLSKPYWIWGAEMGVNEFGVCIGNEAVHTIGEYSQNGLLGMDLLRLALERANSAKIAVEVIIDLLKTYGQGGNCGFQKEEYYDNSFLIMDRNDLFILETKDRKWAVKKQKGASISNYLTIKKADKFNDVSNFKKKYIAKRDKKILLEAKFRRQLTSRKMKKVKTEEDIFQMMRQHSIFCKNGTDKSPCMHNRNGYQTTASMVVILEEKPMIWFTASSLPCLSLYKPYQFGDYISKEVIKKEEELKLQYWNTSEERRAILEKGKIPYQFYQERNEIEKKWIKQFKENSKKEESYLEEVIKQEELFYQKWIKQKV